MKEFTKMYRNMCKELLNSMSFSRKASIFYRVINDILQTVYIENLGTYSNGTEYRICFGVAPLCNKIEYLDFGRYDLKRFEVCPDTPIDSWICKDSEACLQSIKHYFVEYLIPFFEKANSSEKALLSVIELEKLVAKKRREYLLIHNMEDHSPNSQGVSFLDSQKYYMALKCENYDFAQKCLQAFLEQNIDAYLSVKGIVSKEVLERRANKIKTMQADILHFERGNYQHFKRIMEDNERQTKEFLQKVHVT